MICTHIVFIECDDIYSLDAALVTGITGTADGIRQLDTTVRSGPGSIYLRRITGHQQQG